jgi:hypothetical protein
MVTPRQAVTQETDQQRGDVGQAPEAGQQSHDGQDVDRGHEAGHGPVGAGSHLGLSLAAAGLVQSHGATVHIRPATDGGGGEGALGGGAGARE